MPASDTEISKYLSFVLRHAPEEAGPVAATGRMSC